MVAALGLNGAFKGFFFRRLKMIGRTKQVATKPYMIVIFPTTNCPLTGDVSPAIATPM
mgnify:CR=1 FL=1